MLGRACVPIRVCLSVSQAPYSKWGPVRKLNKHWASVWDQSAPGCRSRRPCPPSSIRRDSDSDREVVQKGVCVTAENNNMTWHGLLCSDADRCWKSFPAVSALACPPILAATRCSPANASRRTIINHEERGFGLIKALRHIP